MTENLNVPVLFMIFNRPSTTIPVFERIKLAKPNILYIAADGPRSKQGEAQACQEARRIVENIDWNCEVHTLFRSNNLGCKEAIRTAIDWFFENEDMGIILEDDCLADSSFFNYCEILLNKYKDEKQVMMITGTSYLNSGITGHDKFYFSQYFAIWGWATWRRAWLEYDKDMKAWPEIRRSLILKDKYGPYLGSVLESLCQSTYEGKCDTWDIQWFISCLNKDGLCIAPKINLISNIGTVGVHFKGIENPLLNVPVNSIGEISNFPKVQFDEKTDKRAYKKIAKYMCPPLTGKYYIIIYILQKINKDKFCNPKIPILYRLKTMNKI